jgi:hypothetical protein
MSQCTLSKFVRYDVDQQSVVNMNKHVMSINLRDSISSHAL